MRRSLALAAALVAVLAAPPALARGPGGFQGRIPTEDNPLTDETRLARMRREGRLPDSFTQGGCRYDLAGDPAMAYYVKQCGRR